ncbi:RNA recognition motif domain [Macleaya cordata]|uniref:RNA recognition motif domain n=1 Tax=Macleaya cordata TaxID=56857 RepID=A0A200QHI1_MACCD|nr:RNA recognition motif domain [Macleaya cordata]
MSNNNNNNNYYYGGGGGQFGDTTLTKVFVGGLAWETQKEALRDHFEKYGEILEAVIISDKLTSRSKGYGFVTFKEPEAAKNACEDPTPMINGRRANCNLASLGARRQKLPSSPTTTSQQGSNGGTRSTSSVPSNQVQWYYPTGAPASPFQHHHAIPLHAYGYSPTYIATDFNYNQKVSYSGGSYMNGHFTQVYQGGQGAMMPVYPYYQFHHQSQTMGVPAHVAGPMTTAPALISKPPAAMAPNTGWLA